MSQPDSGARRRAVLVLLGVVVAVLALIAAVVVAVGSRDDPQTNGTPPAAPSTAVPADGSADSADAEELASRPMLRLPAQAAQPQAMTTRTAGPPIMLPDPARTVGRWIPGGFPDTAEGALAQLTALNETGLAGGDPQVYARAYRERSLPGAPDPASTGLWAVLTSLRSHAGLPGSGIVADLRVSYDVTHGLVKGSAEDGRFTVVCVLGLLAADYQGRTVSAGVGDCQAMRWTGTEWRISPGTLAAPASNAWPGSADAVKAGYRELR